MSKEFILKVFFAAGLLFVFFLYSGGIYQYSQLDGSGHARINKITNTTEILQYSGDKYYWVDLKIRKAK